MSRILSLAAILAAALAMAACAEQPASAPPSKTQVGADAGYAISPSLTSVTVKPGGMVLQGLAAPRAAVRLASPEGEAFVAAADGQGRWRLALPLADRGRIFGLSMAASGRPVQAQGYILVTADGEAVLLRAGTGALRFETKRAPRLTVFDFDREGGAAASGFAPPNAAVVVRIDGTQAADGRADAEGRFNIALTQPVAAGRHVIAIAGERFGDAAVVELASAPPLQGGPFRTTSTSSGLRVDWMTPGGGVQSTLLLN